MDVNRRVRGETGQHLSPPSSAGAMILTTLNTESRLSSEAIPGTYHTARYDTGCELKPQIDNKTVARLMVPPTLWVAREDQHGV